MSQYNLEPLAESEGVPMEFRILTILSGAGKKEDDIQCTITHHPFAIGSDIEPSVEYEALSWTWGAENEKLQEIQIANAKTKIRDASTRSFAVKPNLFRALQYLRLPDKDRRMWVDYVCIDQHNPIEKNLQVQFMSEIYGKATNVCIWLGDHYHESEKAMDFIKHQINDFNSLQRITEEVRFRHEWKALAALMNRPWFSRRWVVQELALAKTATVHCAERIITWAEFETAASLFDRNSDQLAELFRGQEEADLHRELFGNVAHMGAMRLVYLRSNLFRFDDAGKIMECRMTLTDLVSSLGGFRAKEPHDLIYAILALASDAHAYNRITTVCQPRAQPPLIEGLDDSDLSSLSATASRRARWRRIRSDQFAGAFHRRKTFEITYDQPFFVLCKEFLRLAIESTDQHNLDILLRPWAPSSASDPHSTLPSWIPHLRNAAFKPVPAVNAPGFYHMWRVNADPLVGQTTHDSRLSCYNACRFPKTTRDEWSLTEDKYDHEMTVSGFVLDKIGQLEDASRAGNIPEEWLNLGGWTRTETPAINEDSQAHDALLRTLVADRGEDGRNIPGYYRKSFFQAIYGSPEGIHIRLKNDGHPILAEFLRRVEAVVTNRRLFRCEREGHLGLAPKQAQEGDYICIIRGVSVPVVLRPIEKDDPKRWGCIVIGECYLHTMMDGRAIDVQEARLQGLREQLKHDDHSFRQLQPWIRKRRTQEIHELWLREMKLTLEVAGNEHEMKAFNREVKRRRKLHSEERAYEELESRIMNNKREEALLTSQKFVLV